MESSSIKTSISKGGSVKTINLEEFEQELWNKQPEHGGGSKCWIMPQEIIDLVDEYEGKIINGKKISRKTIFEVCKERFNLGIAKSTFNQAYKRAKEKNNP